MNNAALVLEGGSLRSLYTAGVLDVFLEHNIEFSCVIAVSAGALTAANYISDQRMRTAQINILHSGDPNYYGIKQLFAQKSAFNFDYLFNDPIDKLYPYNRKRLSQTKQRFFVSATNCETGCIQYFDAGGEYERMIEFLKASSSQPLLAPMVKIGGISYLDGGITAPIGIEKAFEEKYKKVVVVLTRERNYIKEPKSIPIRALFEIYYRHYPKLLDALHKMPCVYNELKRKVNQLEEEGKIFVVQPKKMIKIGSVEKNARKLAKLYFQGLYDAERSIDAMQKYINL